MHPGASGWGSLWSSWQHCAVMMPDTRREKVLLPLVCDFEHQETDICRVRHFLKSNCLIFLGIGCLIGVFLKGKRGWHLQHRAKKASPLSRMKLGQNTFTPAKILLWRSLMPWLSNAGNWNLLGINHWARDVPFDFLLKLKWSLSIWGFFKILWPSVPAGWWFFC